MIMTGKYREGNHFPFLTSFPSCDIVIVEEVKKSPDVGILQKYFKEVYQHEQ